jgi:hypothetical protein
MQCAVCRVNPVDIGVLCEECRDELPQPGRITPEQVLSHAALPTPAALIDRWGRPHALDRFMVIGRHVDGSCVSVLEASISRNHARVELDAQSKSWRVTDLGSANGTFHNEQTMTANQPVSLKRGDKIAVSTIGFYFLDDATNLPDVDADPISAETIRRTGRLTLDNIPPPPPDEFEEEEHTAVGLPVSDIKLHEPTGGGGGLVSVDGKQVQLTATQFELIALLVKRMAEEGHQPDLVRGFVRTSELIADLSWDTRDPGDNHVKQLVRRVRRALIKADIGDLVESRHRFGYRLRVIPRSAAAS